MWVERDAADLGASESFDQAVRGCRTGVALVMRRRVKLRVVRGQDRSRRGAAKHSKFSKWDCDFMLQPSTPWVGTELDLSGCESLDHHHGSAILRTEPIGAHVLGRGCCCFGLR
jgi:hypothetical protein